MKLQRATFRRIFNVIVLATVASVLLIPFGPLASPLPATPAGADPAPALTLVGTVPIPAEPRLMAVNSVTHRAYVAVGNGFTSSTHFVSVIDGTTNIANIAVPDFSTGPIYVATNDVTNRVYVSHTGSYYVSAIDGATNSVLATNIGAGILSYPEGIGANPLTNFIYVANTNGASVSVIDGASNTVVQTLPVGGGNSNRYLTVIPATNRVFMTDNIGKQIVVINGRTSSVAASVNTTFSLGALAPTLIASNPTTNRLYVVVSGSSNLLVLDAASGATVASVPVGGEVTGVAVSQSPNRIYVTSAGSSVLTIIDGATNTVAGTVTLPDVAHRVAADATNGRVYVGHIHLGPADPTPHVVWVLAAFIPQTGPTYVVTRSDDPAPDGCNVGDCSLREAIAAAASGDTVTFAPGLTGPIALTSGHLVINKNLTIQGPGAGQLTISGGIASQGGAIYNNGFSLTITNITFTGNLAPSNSGGAIYNNGGSLTVTNSTFSGNTAGAAGGGAIYNNIGSLTVTNSTFSGNFSSSSGGAIFNNGPSVTIITNSTFSGNSVFSQAGGAIFNSGSLTITNSTFSGNSASTQGGAIFNNGPGVSLGNTIIAGNTASTGPDISGGIASRGHNLVGNGAGASGLTNGTNGDQVGSAVSPINPMLGPLALNGGDTATQVLLSGSPAIDAGDNAMCAAAVGSPTYGAGGLDQRGVTRPQGTACDIGSVELILIAGTIQFFTDSQALSESSTAVAISVTRTNGSAGAVGVTVATTAGGTATGGASCTPGVDFITLSTTLAWADGETGTKQAVLSVCPDAAVEPDETVKLFLSSPTGGATLGTPNTMIHTILNDDVAAAGTIQFFIASQAFSESSTAVAINVTRTNGSSGAVGVTVATTGGGTATAGASCTAGVDFITLSTTLAWADGETGIKQAVLFFCPDAAVEPDETVNLALSSPTGGATLGTPSAMVHTIQNDDVAAVGTIQFNTASQALSESSTAVAISVTRTNGSAGAVGVTVATTAGGTATGGASCTPGVDFISLSTTLAWADGETGIKQAVLFFCPDAAVEPDETVNLALSSPTGGATLGTPSAMVHTIQNDDVAAAACSLLNPSFETGNLSGWTIFVPPGGLIAAVTSAGSYTPKDGTYFAFIKTNGPGSYSTVSQTFSAAAGGTIAGWAFFKAEDYMPFNDNAQVTIKSGSTVQATLFSASVSTVGNFGGTPWTSWQYTFATPGTYTVEARIANALDSIADSYMGMDGIGCTGVATGDTTPPTTTTSVSPAPNVNGWNNTNVTVSFSATDIGSGVQEIVYSVDGGAPVVTAGATASTVLSAEGVHTVSYYAQDNAGNTSSTATVTAKIDKTAPALTPPANITTAATSAAGAVATYTVTATDNLTPSPTVSCSPASGSTFPVGTTTVNCTATDLAGNSSSGSFTVTVTALNQPPTANAGGPYSVPEGSSVTLLGSGSDPNGDPLTYAWDLDNNGTFETPGQNVTFSAAGLDGPSSKTVVLRVCDNQGACATSSATVTVNNVAPTITSVTNNGPVNEGSSATITVTATDPAGPNDPLSYQFDCNNDGIYEIGPQPGNTASCAFADNGSFLVTVSVDDYDGGVATGSTTVVVNNVAPTANAGGPYSVNEGGSVGLAGSGSDPGADALSYSWDLDNNGIFETPGQNPTFSAAGLDGPSSKTVVLQVCDDDGACATSSTTVTVNNVAPTITSVSNNGPINEGSSATITVVATDPAGPNDPLSYQFDCNNDGIYDVGPQAANSASCAFADNGSYLVKVSVDDYDGGVATGSTTVTVNNVAPTANAGGPYSVNEGGSVALTGSGSDPGADALTYSWDLDNNGTFETPGQNPTFSAAGLDGPSSQSVTLRVCDDDVACATSSATVNIVNVAPTITAVTNNGPINEGSSATITVTAIDPAGPNDPLSYQFDCNNDGIYEIVPQPGNTASCTFADNGSYLVKVSVDDYDGGVAIGFTMVTVNNVAPTATLGNNGPVNEGSPATITFSNQADPSSADLASLHYAFDCNGGSLASATYAGGGTSATTGCTYADNGTYTVTGKVMDKDGDSSTYQTVVTVNNVAPTVNAGADAAIDEGGTISGSGSFTDPGADTWTATVDYGDGSGAQPLVLTGKSFNLSHLYADNGPYTVTVTVTDDDGGIGTDTVLVTVNNVAPAVNAGADAAIDEGGTFAGSGSFTDPGADTWTATVDYGDGSGVQPLVLTDKSFNLSHLYADNGPYTVTVTVTDDDSGVGTDTVLVTVNNVAPANITLSLSAASINENGSVILTGSFTDPGILDTHIVAINWGDGSYATVLNLSAAVLSFSASHQYLDDNPTGTASDSNNISVTVTDKDGGAGNGSAPITVNNVPPAITGVSGPSAPLALGTSATVGATYTDLGTQDTHTCTFSWDDGSSNTTVPGSGGSCSAAYTYAGAGVYTVSVTVTDDDTGSASAVFQFVVVYDPSAGFVTGGGWINSPAGAYPADPTLTGKATFGFVSKYQKGATTPSGNTEFQFHAAGLNFKSTSYQWLVISGPKAQYKGAGTINGVSGYGFLLTATDGQVAGGGGVDKFRIKIWNLATDAVVYDNVLGASDDMDSANPQAISGGSITIHSK